MRRSGAQVIACCVLSVWLLGLLAGCHGGRSPRDGAARRAGRACGGATPLDAMACEYVGLALALGERDPDSLDFATVPAQEVAEAHAQYLGLDEIARRAGELRERVLKVDAADAEARGRVAVLALQLAAIGTRVEMLRGRVFRFDEEAGRLFDTKRLPDTEAARRRQVRAAVARLLPAEDQQASLAKRYAAYERRLLVPPDRLQAVMGASLAACRAETLKHVALPAGEAVELRFVRNQPWSAFSRYRGQGRSTIAVNVDFPVTVDGALDLACHEGYPGHHVFNTLREAALVRERHWPEAEVQLTFSPQSYVSEAAAAFAPEMAMPAEERSRVERERLFPLAGLPVAEAERSVRISGLMRELDSAQPAIAQQYLDGELEFVRAEEALANETLMEHAEASLLYLNEYRSYMLAYTDGRRRVRALLGASAANGGDAQTRRWAAYVGMMREFRMSLPGVTP